MPRVEAMLPAVVKSLPLYPEGLSPPGLYFSGGDLLKRGPCTSQHASRMDYHGICQENSKNLYGVGIIPTNYLLSPNAILANITKIILMSCVYMHIHKAWIKRYYP